MVASILKWLTENTDWLFEGIGKDVLRAMFIGAIAWIAVLGRWVTSRLRVAPAAARDQRVVTMESTKPAQSAPTTNRRRSSKKSRAVKPPPPPFDRAIYLIRPLPAQIIAEIKSAPPLQHAKR